MTWVFAIASGIAYILAYLDYNRQVIKGATRPNGATWLIWSVISIVSATSYLKASGDVWKSVIPLLNIGLCTATFVLAVYLKNIKWPDKMDYVALAIGIIAALVWKHYGSARYANLIVQLAVLAGFVPTWRGILKDPTCEQARPWIIWMVGYILALIVVTLRWNGQWIDAVYPVMCIVLHASIPILGKMRQQYKPNPFISTPT